MKTSCSRGQMIPMYLFLVVAVAGLLFATIQLGRSSAWGMKEKRNMTALQLAQAGLNHGYHWLREDPARWDATAGASTIFNPAPLFGQGPDTSLQVEIGPGSSPSERRIRAEGRSRWPGSAKVETRRLEAALARGFPSAALVVSRSMGLGGAVQVHWGPVVSLGDIDLAGAAASNGHPRKRARGRITVNGAEAAADGVEFFPLSADIPELPALDLAAYRNRALCQTDGGAPLAGSRVPSPAGPPLNCPSPGAPSNVYQPDSNGEVKLSFADPHPDDPNAPMNVDAAAEDRVRYVEGALSVTGASYLRGALIVLGDLTLAGTGAGRYAASVPASARQEYAKVDTAAQDEYPADLGASANASFKFGASGAPLREGTAEKVGLNGFVYVTGRLRAVGNQTLHGAVWVDPSGAGTQGSVAAYYRDVTAGMLAASGTGDFTVLRIRSLP